MITGLDTNVVLCFLLNDIPEQSAKATKLISEDPVYVTDVVVAETIIVLEKIYRLNHKDIGELITDFLGLNNLIYNKYFLNQTIDLYVERPSLSFVDCYSALEAKAYQNKLVTFDKALAKHGGNHVKEL